MGPKSNWLTALIVRVIVIGFLAFMSVVGVWMICSLLEIAVLQPIWGPQYPFRAVGDTFATWVTGSDGGAIVGILYGALWGVLVGPRIRSGAPPAFVPAWVEKLEDTESGLSSAVARELMSHPIPVFWSPDTKAEKIAFAVGGERVAALSSQVAQSSDCVKEVRGRLGRLRDSMSELRSESVTWKDLEGDGLLRALGPERPSE